MCIFIISHFYRFVNALFAAFVIFLTGNAAADIDDPQKTLTYCIEKNRGRKSIYILCNRINPKQYFMKNKVFGFA